MHADRSERAATMFRFFRLAPFALAMIQVAAGVATLRRLARPPDLAPLTAGAPAPPPASIAIVVPVLDEADRIAACLRSLVRLGPEVGEILIVDGGSRDATREIVGSFAAWDERLRVVRAERPPAGWNNKVWNLAQGLAALRAPWVLMIDADVTFDPALPAALYAAREHGAVSVATEQRTSDPLSAALHAAFLATLVYRNGRPGRIGRRPGEIAANGQIFFCEAQALRTSAALEAARASRCDDLTIAHALAAAGTPVAFVEAPGLASAAMYADPVDLLANWPRSLGLSDDATRPFAARRLAEVVLAGAAPLPLLLALRGRSGRGAATLRAVNAALFAARLGIAAGTARAYRAPRAGIVAAPLFDVVALAAILRAALQPRPKWRGRRLVA